MTALTDNESPKAWGLFRRRLVWVPTWKGMALIACVVGLGGFAIARQMCAFLAVVDRVGGPVLVMEGWTPDFVAEACIAEFRRGGYQRVLVTGGVIEKGQPLSEWKTCAQLGQATLIRMGFPAEKVVAVVGRAVDRDRTYDSAVQLREWFKREGGLPPVLQLISCGPHGRRTRLLFEAALGSGTRVGMISVPDPKYPLRHWWINSTGFRDVIAETVAYCYARFVFRAAPAPTMEAGPGMSASH